MEKLNKKIFEWYNNLPNKKEYTNPYLIIPTKEYIESDCRVLVLGKETNGWGEKEECKTMQELQALYQNEINKDCGKNINTSFWQLYSSLRRRIQESNVKCSIGWCVSNVSLLGYHYGTSGFDTSLTSALADFFKNMIEILQPNIILCFIGVGTKTARDAPYIPILEHTFGKYLNNIPVSETEKQQLQKMEFANTNNVKIYGTRHPDRAGNDWRNNICEEVKLLLENYYNLD